MAFFCSITSRLRSFWEAVKIELAAGNYSADLVPRHLDRSGANKPKDRLGDRGEQLARDFYKNRKASIIDANLLIGRTEIDLIVEEKGTIVFIEVKTRSSRDFDEDPADAVSNRKKQKMIQAARQYLRWRRWEKMPVRFDIIAVYWPNGAEPVLTHHKNAFR